MSKSANKSSSEYPAALPSNYNPQNPQHAQYYAYDPNLPPQGQQYAPQPQANAAPGGMYYAGAPSQQQQQHLQQPLRHGYANNPATAQVNGNRAEASYQPPVVQSGAAPAAPAYYDYTLPQSFEDISKFQADGKWATSLCKAPCAEPCFCISSFFCPCCCTYMQRKRLLIDDWSRYRCCAGICGQCCCLKSNCGKCAPFCLAMETIFCLSCAVHGNRFMVMQHYGLEQECCDCVIIWSACVLQLIGMIIGSDFIQSAADCLYSVVLSCILSQNEHQMKRFQYPTRSAMT